ARAVMRSPRAGGWTDKPQPLEGSAPVDSTRCHYDARAISDTDSLAARLYDCYGAAAHAVPVDGESLERLTVLGLLGVTADRALRRRLFLGLDHVWRTVNSADDPASPSPELLPPQARS